MRVGKGALLSVVAALTLEGGDIVVVALSAIEVDAVSDTITEIVTPLDAVASELAGAATVSAAVCEPETVDGAEADAVLHACELGRPVGDADGQPVILADAVPVAVADGDKAEDCEPGGVVEADAHDDGVGVAEAAARDGESVAVDDPDGLLEAVVAVALVHPDGVLEAERVAAPLVVALPVALAHAL